VCIHLEISLVTYADIHTFYQYGYILTLLTGAYISICSLIDLNIVGYI